MTVGFLMPINSSIALYHNYYDQTVQLPAVVVKAPEYRESYQRLIVSPTDFANQPGSKLLITSDVYQKFIVGDEVLMRGKIKPIENFMGETGREFNYQNYLALQDVSAQIRFARLEHTGNFEPSIKRTLAILKGHYLNALSYKLPEPHSSLAGGITVGANDALGDQVDELFRRTGLTHIVVLSGYNVAIVILALSSALAFLPYWIAAGISFAGIWLFVFLVGASATIIRAGIMASIAVVSRLYGSEVSALGMLAAAVILMTINQPLITLYDPSFQLSVLATIGIIVVTPIIERYFKFVSPKLGLREIVVTTLATQITVIPWLVYLMGQFSIVSPLANVLVLPAVPWAMLGSFLTYVFSAVLPIFSSLFALISYGLLDYIFVISNNLGSWELASLTVSSLPFYLITIIYILIGLLLYKLQRHYLKQVSDQT
jgi:competence protein ComEC